MKNRRNFIKVIGSLGVIYANSNVLTGCTSLDSNKPDAYAAWTGPGQNLTDPRVWALSYAILAPNPHNRQPWSVDLRKENEILIYIDEKRLLPVTDPFSRQIKIGTGAFLEVLRIAAAEKGYDAQIQILWSESKGAHLFDRPFAQVTLVKNSNIKPDPLFQFVLLRTTNRNPHDVSKLLPNNLKQMLESNQDSKANVRFTSNAKEVLEMTDLSVGAMEKELRTHLAYKESVDLFRIGEIEINKNPDGISLRGFMLETLNSFGLLDRKEMTDPKSSSFKQGLDKTLNPLKLSASFFWITTPGNTFADQILAGKIYVRSQLELTGLGLSAQPVSQALQEYPEMKELYKEAYELMKVPKNETLQMWARVGFAKKEFKSPRWPLNSFLKSI